MYKLIKNSYFDLLGGTVNDHNYVGNFKIDNGLIKIDENIQNTVKINNIDIGI